MNRSRAGKMVADVRVLLLLLPGSVRPKISSQPPSCRFLRPSSLQAAPVRLGLPAGSWGSKLTQPVSLAAAQGRMGGIPLFVCFSVFYSQ